MLQPITPPPTITTWARLGKSVGMSRPFLVVLITAITSTGCPRWSRHVPAADPDDDFVVMTDPGGNEFCVCAVPDLS
jgi:hypothetical protein